MGSPASTPPYHRGMPNPLPRNAELADQLDLLADLSEILNEDSFRVIAYRRAATRIRESPSPVARLALDGKAKELPGIGKTIEEKVVEVVNEGEMAALRRRRERVPVGVVDFLRLPGVGPKTAARIWTELGVTTLEALKAAAEDNRLRALSGLGARSEEKILQALEAGVGEQAEPRRLLGTALPAVRRVVAELEAHPSSSAVSEAGSVRRRRETVRDLDLIATATDAPALIATFCEAEWVAEVVARGDTKATVAGHDGLRFDLRVVPPECYGNVLQHFTGSKDHNVALREDAQRRGLSISEYGVTIVETGEVVTHATEDELYAYLGYALVPPELREAGGEIAAAREGRLPELVELSDLRGEMHCHSTWSSDAKNSIEEMAVTAKSRGYTYLCLTDHSHYLRDRRLEAQWAEIESVNARLKQFRVLRGIEVNIRADGSLDVDDDVLAELDWVIASLHTSFDRSPTERILGAMDNPHVDSIGHLTGRRLLTREGAIVDAERLIEHAAATGTALEINSQPDRLDMRDIHARLAGEAGVRIPVTTDAHSVGALANVELGVAQARRAWLTKDQVLNTRSWREVERMKGR
jgi:DNA polymerase (family 10)